MDLHKRLTIVLGARELIIRVGLIIRRLAVVETRLSRLPARLARARIEFRPFGPVIRARERPRLRCSYILIRAASAAVHDRVGRKYRRFIELVDEPGVGDARRQPPCLIPFDRAIKGLVRPTVGTVRRSLRRDRTRRGRRKIHERHARRRRICGERRERGQNRAKSGERETTVLHCTNLLNNTRRIIAQ